MLYFVYVPVIIFISFFFPKGRFADARVEVMTVLPLQTEDSGPRACSAVRPCPP